jgi:hypothetical protein
MDLSGCGPIRKPCRLCTWPDNAQHPDQAIPVPCQENAVRGCAGELVRMRRHAHMDECVYYVCP